MGKVLSLFRKEPSSEEKLTKLEEQIKDLEGYTVSTRETQRKFAGRFLVASIGTYVISFIVFYFYFFPPTWRDRLIYSLPLLLFPVVIILLKYVVSWYFNSKIDRNNRKLIQLRNDKRKVLQNVMDKETYKVALEILNTFGDKSMRLKASHDLDSSMALNNSVQMNTTSSQLVARTPVRGNTQSNRPMGGGGLNTPSAPLNQTTTHLRGTPAPIGFRATAGLQQPVTPHMMSRPPGTPAGIPPLSFNTQKTPFPVIDQRKQNVMEKMMDFIISDGPSNRFAMICSSCCGHNGMALQEDFEYVAFKCAFCGHLNPARKIRPKARGLSPDRRPQLQQLANKAMDTSSSDEEEDGDDESAVQKPPAIQTEQASEMAFNSSSEDEKMDVEVEKAAGEHNNNNGEEETGESKPKDSEEKKKD